MWPDNETERDFLNFSGVVETVAEVVVALSTCGPKVELSRIRAVDQPTVIASQVAKERARSIRW